MACLEPNPWRLLFLWAVFSKEAPLNDLVSRRGLEANLQHVLIRLAIRFSSHESTGLLRVSALSNIWLHESVTQSLIAPEWADNIEFLNERAEDQTMDLG